MKTLRSHTLHWQREITLKHCVFTVGENERIISLGAVMGKLASGTGSIAGFKEDKRNRANQSKCLDYKNAMFTVNWFFLCKSWMWIKLTIVNLECE